MTAHTPPERQQPEIDWEAIERDYRAGIKTLREIASKHPGTNHVAITRRAKKEGWERDLVARIQAKTDELVTKNAVTESVTKNPVTEAEIVLENAAQAAAIRLGQRKDFARLRTIITRQMTELEESDGIDLSERSKIAKQLADTLRIAVDLERREFGMDKVAPTDDPLTAMLKRINSAAASAFKPVADDPAYSGMDD
jgi:hypothetical protein